MGEHLVQFYEDEAVLIHHVWRFINPALQTGKAAIVIATEPHLKSLEKRLPQSGKTSLRRPYIALDAEETLDKICVRGWPDESRFKEIVGTLVGRASQNGKNHVLAFGEMVALLCAKDRPEAAIHLEQCWNRLAQSHAFTLLCGYPMKSFHRYEDGGAFKRVCEAHTHVLPAETHRAPAGHDEMCRTIAQLQQKAAALESEVAQRKEIADALQLRERELADLNRRKDEFLAMLGHELRNPLAPILASLELMRLHAGDAAQTARRRETIERQVALMTRLVDDLLDVSRITRGRIALKMEMVSLDDIIEHAVETARPLIDERGHHLCLALPGHPIRLSADPARLSQVLSNLLHNAAKYTEAGGRISIEAQEEDDRLVLSVSDDGIGLEEDQRARIFDLFVQGPDAHARAQGGLGLGLTLVRSLVQLHGGTVEARSDGPGLGSTFIVCLPLRAPEAPGVRQASGRRHVAAAEHVRSRSILIVDDNIDAAESLGEVLKAAGHIIFMAHDGAGALEVAARIQPEVVILDIGMPRMDGYQVATRLRATPGLSCAVLVAVTGYTQEDDRMRAHQAGFDHHFAKPLDMGRLAALLNS